MKKEYKKPQVIIESFVLNANLAANCMQTINLPSQFTCGIPAEDGSGLNIFSPDLDGSNCVIPGESGDAMYDGLCYHVPTEGLQLFNS